MSRPSRIEYRGAWGHAMNRGRRREPIYLGRDDHPRFLRVLPEDWDDTCEKPNTRRGPFLSVNPVKHSVGSCARRANDEESRVGGADASHFLAEKAENWSDGASNVAS